MRRGSVERLEPEPTATVQPAYYTSNPLRPWKVVDQGIAEAQIGKMVTKLAVGFGNHKD